MKKIKLKDVRVGQVINCGQLTDYYWNVESQKHHGLQLWYLPEMNVVAMHFRGSICWVPTANIAHFSPMVEEEVKAEPATKRAAG